MQNGLSSPGTVRMTFTVAVAVARLGLVRQVQLREHHCCSRDPPPRGEACTCRRDPGRTSSGLWLDYIQRQSEGSAPPCLKPNPPAHCNQIATILIPGLVRQRLTELAAEGTSGRPVLAMVGTLDQFCSLQNFDW